MSKRDLSPAERKIWARVVQSVQPMKGEAAKDVTPFRLPEPGQVLPETREQTEETYRPKAVWTLPVPGRAEEQKRTYPVPGDRSGEKRVRRGQTPIAASFDLHGFTQDKAAIALYQFVSSQRSQGARCVLVITGRGKAGGGVLRERLIDWLSQPNMRVHVSGYSQANRKHGGAGAWYVFLRAWPRRE